ncbi:hypothetical protein GALL_404320 [mine drainage metagenome]|uniref:Uncharacterized protein n=1 Tax=mine drainage metagenome TaxID=410659 RepID=A0A1J5Q3J1_9ZZZZ
MHHPAVLGMAIAFRHAPPGGGGADQQDAGGGPHAAQLLPGRRDAGTAAGELHAEAGMVVDRSHRRRFDADAAPVGFQLFRDQHGQRGIHPLPHFGLVDDDSDAVVRCDADEGIGRIDRGRRRIGGQRTAAFHRQIKTDDEAAHQGNRICQEFAAARSLQHGRLHFASPFNPADASATALRMRL